MPATHDDSISDYGSDFTAEEELILEQLLASAGANSGNKPTVVTEPQSALVIDPRPSDVSAAANEGIAATSIPQESRRLQPAQIRGHGVGIIRGMQAWNSI